ncbi:HAMP domain-containing sensor histidine kinase [Eubacterium sp. 1001713B170207_170306_E7]|uniref:sensor histidine kinase n=1 Tax=Eubacterium sp. 1001713B170207_170306_E7 TaxID=2787097 RepID=UPI001FAC208E|nr:HAMP domain-containing sensor histidine kinase [Eubacterium sp. 1001713B170207_170306_E7]
MRKKRIPSALQEWMSIGLMAALTAAFLLLVFALTDGETGALLRLAAVVFAVAFWGIFYAFQLICKRRFVAFADGLCSNLDSLIQNEGIQAFSLEEETLTSKVQMKLNQLYEVTNAAIQENGEQKLAVQRIVSDISHQLKTPIANIKMYADTVTNPQVPEEKRRFFLDGLQNQVEKLDFLIQVLTKISRLENGQIALKAERQAFYPTLAQALSGITLPAEKKGITVSVVCDEALELYHDSKWTAEALFNLLENAVKYTPEGGRVSVSAEQWEMYTRIEIADTGIGVSEEHMNDIFKRFYRESKVQSTPGIGVGLYLAREIIGKEQGYIKVASQAGEGSVFSVFLPNQAG